MDELAEITVPFLLYAKLSKETDNEIMKIPARPRLVRFAFYYVY